MFNWYVECQSVILVFTISYNFKQGGIIMRKLAVLSVCFALVFCVSFTSSATASDEDDVLKVMNSWFEAFNACDGDKISALYLNSDKTTSFGPDTGAAFLSQGEQKWTFDVPPGTYMNTNHHPQVTLLGKDVAIFTNYNTSVYTDPATKAQSISQVRGTFVLQKIGGKWLIVHEHSSLLPTE